MLKAQDELTSDLVSKTIKLRLVEEADAEFILSLRLDERYNQHLSRVSNDIDQQRTWIRNYKKDETNGKEYYFIIERHDHTPCGTVRVYDLRSDSFCWGSWILNTAKTRYAAIETALLVYKFGFEKLGYQKSHFEVLRENEKVIAFHTKFGAKKIGEDSENYYFNFHRSAYHEKSSEFHHLLTQAQSC